jgi:hypothetical protein
LKPDAKGHSSPYTNKQLIHIDPVQSDDSSSMSASSVIQPEASADAQVNNLAKALSDTLGASRLVAPEPEVFSGDALKFTAWKAAFTTL